MEPLLQHEMSELLGLSSTKIHASFKDAIEKIKTFPDYEALADLFED